jgi:hypothetical protein
MLHSRLSSSAGSVSDAKWVVLVLVGAYMS